MVLNKYVSGFCLNARFSFLQICIFSLYKSDGMWITSGLLIWLHLYLRKKKKKNISSTLWIFASVCGGVRKRPVRWAQHQLTTAGQWHQLLDRNVMARLQFQAHFFHQWNYHAVTTSNCNWKLKWIIIFK